MGKDGDENRGFGAAAAVTRCGGVSSPAAEGDESEPGERGHPAASDVGDAAREEVPQAVVGCRDVAAGENDREDLSDAGRETRDDCRLDRSVRALAVGEGETAGGEAERDDEERDDDDQ